MPKQQFKNAILTMAAADTEYSYEFPENVERFSVQLRDPSVATRISAVAGKVATSADPYFTLPANSEWTEDNLFEPNTRKFYFATANATMVLEIRYWVGIRRSS